MPGTLAMLEFETLGLSRIGIPLGARRIGHDLVAADCEVNEPA